MKRYVYAILIFCLANHVTAQNAKFGVFIDPQLTWLNPDTRNVIGDGVAMGVNGGLVIDKYFQKNYAVQTGISIGTQAGSIKYGMETTILSFGEKDTLPPGTTVDYRMNYITVPLGLKLKSNQIGYVSYYAQLGFTGQINIKAHATSSEGSLDKSDISDEIRLFNLAWHCGAGVEYAISEDTALTFGLVYQNGFVNVTDNQNAKFYSRIVSLRLGVMF
jgi:hypothetical protein